MSGTNGTQNTNAAYVNNAPVLNSTGSPAFTDVAQGNTNPAGDSVAALIASGGAGYITDVDQGAVQGIAVINAQTANGTWQYSTNGGANWFALPIVTSNAAFLLASMRPTSCASCPMRLSTERP